jgi:prepilin-type N-terminal cleavage/methylation domain-containing protein
MLAVSSARGFTLIEALIASALIATALVTLSYVVATGVAQTSSSRRSVMALVLAQSKLEELRALPFRFAADGSRVDSEELAASPPSTLTEDRDGWVELLDRFGDAANDRQPMHYRRRWAVVPFTAFDLDTLVLQVCVFYSGGAARAATADVCLSSIRTRTP